MKKHFEEVSQELINQVNLQTRTLCFPSAQSAIENGSYRFWCETVITFFFQKLVIKSEFNMLDSLRFANILRSLCLICRILWCVKPNKIVIYRRLTVLLA